MSLHIQTGTPPLISGAMARVERRMPHPGKILVRVGQRVEPDDIIARCFVPSAPQIINLARALAIAPSKISRAMLLEVGNKVEQGAVLARTSRLGGGTCLAPVFCHARHPPVSRHQYREHHRLNRFADND